MQSGCKLNQTTQKDLRIILLLVPHLLPDILPCFMGMPVMTVVEEADAISEALTLLIGEAWFREI
jgi:hypothetical protein